MKKRPQKYASFIINALREGDIPEGLYHEILEWLADPNSKEEVNAALKEYWESLEYFETKRTYKAMSTVCAELGIESLKDSDAGKSRAYHDLEAYISPHVNEEMNKRGRRSISISKVIGRIAAVVIPLMVLAGIGIWYSNSDRPTQEAPFEKTIIVAESDAEKHIFLPDGTEAMLNGNSTVEYTANREVRLDGEAYFKVVSDTDNPFFIKTSKLTVKVTGTEFNVKAYPNDQGTTVELYEGNVELSNGRSTRTMTKGMSCYVDNSTGKFEITSGSDARPEWITQKLNLHNKSLPEIFTVLGWYYNVEIEIDERMNDGSLYILELSGEENLTTALGMLQNVSNSFSFRINGKKVTINAAK